MPDVRLWNRPIGQVSPIQSIYRDSQAIPFGSISFIPFQRESLICLSSSPRRCSSRIGPVAHSLLFSFYVLPFYYYSKPAFTRSKATFLRGGGTPMEDQLNPRKKAQALFIDKVD
uniref:Orf114a n=1 Tax=Batis maritima TaxID=4436 RepID=A0A068BD22_BATMA|nr:orf114a [Batis maritima]AIC83342.1 orf114a [Batis maritima]